MRAVSSLFFIIALTAFTPSASANLQPTWTELPACTFNRHECWGRQDYDNGLHYLGEWKNNKRHGFGLLEANGSRPLVGVWENDLFASFDDARTQRMFADKSRRTFAEELREEQLRDALRQDQQRRKTLSGSGVPNHVAQVSFAAQLSALIRSNTHFNAYDVEGNPVVSLVVTLSEECNVVGVVTRVGSGNSRWDKAAELAVWKSSPFPKPQSGQCPKQILVNRSLFEIND